MTIVLYITAVFPAIKFCNALNMFFKSKIFSNVLSLNSNLSVLADAPLTDNGDGTYSCTFNEPTGLIIISCPSLFTYAYISSAMWNYTDRYVLYNKIRNSKISKVEVELVTGVTAKVTITASQKIECITRMIILGN